MKQHMNTSSAVSKSSKDFKIVGYLPDYKDSHVDLVQYSNLTHINYAFVIPNLDGSLKPLDRPGQLRRLVEKAHAQGVQVLISVGGMGYTKEGPSIDSNFIEFTRDEASRAQFIREIAQLVETYNLDGVDIDWEFPYGKYINSFLALMTELSDVMKSRGKLTTAALGIWIGLDDKQKADFFSSIDWLNILAYDNGNNYENSKFIIAQNKLHDMIDGWGLSPGKAVLGVPFYSKPSNTPYAEIVAEDPEAPQKNSSRGHYYNGIALVKEKTRLALTKGGGIMIWELSQDTHDETSLLNAIAEEAGITKSSEK